MSNDSTNSNKPDMSNSQPFVSVVVPVFNREKELKAALISIKEQTYTSIEVLVVDDGSTDDIESIVANLNDNRFHYIHHDTQKGTSSARNTGIMRAAGTYIAFLDSDDTWHPNKLEAQLPQLLNPENDTACFISVTGCEIYKLRGSQNMHRFHTPLPVSGIRRFAWGCDLSPGSTLLAHRIVFENVGLFNEQMRRLEDWDWLIRCTEHYSICVTPQHLSEIHIGSYPKYDVVCQSLKQIDSAHKNKFLDVSFSTYLQFRSSLYLERAASAYLNGALMTACFYGVVCVTIWPFRNFDFFKNALKKLMCRQ